MYFFPYYRNMLNKSVVFFEILGFLHAVSKLFMFFCFRASLFGHAKIVNFLIDQVKELLQSYHDNNLVHR